MSLVQHAQAIRARLRNPPNAVADRPIDLRRKVIQIHNADAVQSVPVNTWEIFGPKIPSLDELAFGPIVCWPERPPPTVHAIQEAVASYYAVDRAELLSMRRQHYVVRVRQIAMYLCRKLTLLSLPAIGRQFSGRDHTTVLYAARKIEKHRADDDALDKELTEIENLLVASTHQIEGQPCSSMQTQT